MARNLIVLTEGEDELLLANPAAPFPLYIQRGRDYVRRFVEAVPALRTAARIAEVFPDDAALLDMLVERKIVVPADEAAAAPAPEPPPRAERSFVSLYLLLTQTCNLQCVYCLDGRETYQTGRRLRMSLEIARASVEKYLRSLLPKGHLEIVFFGGEPLLNWPLVKKVIRFCEAELKPKVPDRTFNYHLTTNLASLPADLIEWATRHRITFLCDVDGPAELHDRTRPFRNGDPSFATIAAHVRRLADAGLSVNLRATVTAVNQHHLPEIAKLHREMGGAGCAFVPVNPANSDGELLPESLLPSPAVVIEGLEAAYRSGVWESRDLYPFNAFASRVGGGAKVTQGCGAPHGMTPVVQCDGRVY
ncbi:MAG: radical SAM protein, partial [Planctomycetes bacterium]|nr:radical SAM protein [Planctomycetota bacterium]